MDKNLQHINKLFNEAKNQEPVISEDFVRTLLEKRALGSHDMYHIPKGVKFMNLISSVALAASSVCLMTVSNPDFKVDNSAKGQNIGKQNTEITINKQEENIADNNVTTYKISLPDSNSRTEPVNVQTFEIQINNDKSDSQIAPTKEEVNNNNTNYNSNTLDITGINPIKLTEEELKGLGFKLENGGHLSFYKNDKSDNTIIETKIESPWGVSIKLLNKNEFKLEDNSMINPSFRFISDQDGNKRLSVFKSNDYEIMTSRTYLSPQSIDNLNSNFCHYGNSIKSQKDISPDVIKLSYLNCTTTTIDNSCLPNDSILKIINDVLPESDRNKKIITTSLTIGSPTDTDEINNTNIIVDYSDALSDITNKLIYGLAPFNILAKDSSNSDVKSFDFDLLDSEINLNELLPVEVDLKDENGNPYIYGGKQKSYIIWFEPTEEFITKLPDAIRKKLSPELEAIPESYESCPEPPVIAGDRPHFDIWRACSGAIENLKVFPVPVKDILTYKYNLSQDRDISLYICNLSGEVMANPLNSAEIHEGCVEEKVDVSFLKPGMYLLVVSSNVGEKAVQRFIVQ